MNTTWLTNDPEVTKTLKAIDRAWEKSRAKAAGWALAEKVSFYRKADTARDEALERLRQRLTA